MPIASCLHESLLKAVETFIFSQTDMDAKNLSELPKPLLFKAFSGATTADDGEMYKSISRFQTSFKASNLRETEGRAERPIKKLHIPEAATLFHRIIDQTSYLPFDKMQAELGPSIYGNASGLETIGSERGRCACIRFQMAGHRVVVGVRASQLKTFMQNEGCK